MKGTLKSRDWKKLLKFKKIIMSMDIEWIFYMRDLYQIFTPSKLFKICLFLMDCKNAISEIFLSQENLDFLMILQVC